VLCPSQSKIRRVSREEVGRRNLGTPHQERTSRTGTRDGVVRAITSENTQEPRSYYTVAPLISGTNLRVLNDCTARFLSGSALATIGEPGWTLVPCGGNARPELKST